MGAEGARFFAIREGISIFIPDSYFDRLNPQLKAGAAEHLIILGRLNPQAPASHTVPWHRRHP
jgi:hypothetical protein